MNKLMAIYKDNTREELIKVITVKAENYEQAARQVDNQLIALGIDITNLSYHMYNVTEELSNAKYV